MTFKLIHQCPDDEIGLNRNITVTFSATSLPDILQEIKYFLRGAGHEVDGELVIEKSERDSNSGWDEWD